MIEQIRYTLIPGAVYLFLRFMCFFDVVPCLEQAIAADIGVMDVLLGLVPTLLSSFALLELLGFGKLQLENIAK